MTFQMITDSFSYLPLLVDALDGGRIVWMSLSKLLMSESYQKKTTKNSEAIVG